MLALGRHSRIKYIGSDPSILSTLQTSKSYAQKGVVFTYAYESQWNPTDGIRLSTWKHRFNKVKPEEWEVVDAKRIDLVRQREKRKVKYADREVRERLDQFTKVFEKMKETKRQIDYLLEDIPLVGKLKILTTLTEEQQAWFDLLVVDKGVVIDAVKKMVKELNDNGGELPEEKR